MTAVAKLHAKFWDHVDKSGGCWNWRGGKTVHGYGRLIVPPRKGVVYAHRHAYELTFGPIPKGLEICHRCDNPSCVNPAHLFAGTHLANMQDARKKMRVRFGERHGGAKLTADNISEIRQLRCEGVEQRSIAVRFAVSQSTVSLILSGKRWALT